MWFIEYAMSSVRHLGLAPVLALILLGCADAPLAPPRIERIGAAQLEARLPQPVATMTLDQVVAASGQGLAAEEIISRIAASGSRYRLSAAQLIDLAQRGVPVAVLDYMVAAERRQIFDEMAADANRREQACLDRVLREVELCRSQSMLQMGIPLRHPFINCFPFPPGSPYMHCM